MSPAKCLQLNDGWLFVVEQEIQGRDRHIAHQREEHVVITDPEHSAGGQ